MQSNIIIYQFSPVEHASKSKSEFEKFEKFLESLSISPLIYVGPEKRY